MSTPTKPQDPQAEQGNQCEEITPPPTRPNTFEAQGQTWTLHIPGDLMPCGGHIHVYVIAENKCVYGPRKAGIFSWRDYNVCPELCIIGWRFAETPYQIVPVKPQENVLDRLARDLQSGDVALVMTHIELRVLIDMVFTSWKTDEQFALLKKLEALRDTRR